MKTEEFVKLSRPWGWRVSSRVCQDLGSGTRSALPRIKWSAFFAFALEPSGTGTPGLWASGRLCRRSASCKHLRPGCLHRLITDHPIDILIFAQAHSGPSFGCRHLCTGSTVPTGSIALCSAAPLSPVIYTGSTHPPRQHWWTFLLVFTQAQYSAREPHLCTGPFPQCLIFHLFLHRLSFTKDLPLPNWMPRTSTALVLAQAQCLPAMRSSICQKSLSFHTGSRSQLTPNFSTLLSTD